MSDTTKDNVLWRLKRGLEVYTYTACYIGAGIIPNVLDQACRHKQRERKRRLAAEANGQVYVPTAMEAEPPVTFTTNNKRAADALAGPNGASKKRRKAKTAKKTAKLIERPGRPKPARSCAFEPPAE